MLFGPLYAGIGAALALCAFSSFLLLLFRNVLMECGPSLDFVTGGVNVLLQEWALDGDPKRFALIATLPVIYCVCLVGLPSLTHVLL